MGPSVSILRTTTRWPSISRCLTVRSSACATAESPITQRWSGAEAGSASSGQTVNVAKLKTNAAFNSAAVTVAALAYGVDSDSITAPHTNRRRQSRLRIGFSSVTHTDAPSRPSAGRVSARQSLRSGYAAMTFNRRNTALTRESSTSGSKGLMM